MNNYWTEFEYVEEINTFLEISNSPKLEMKNSIFP